MLGTRTPTPTRCGGLGKLPAARPSCRMRCASRPCIAAAHTSHIPPHAPTVYRSYASRRPHPTIRIPTFPPWRSHPDTPHPGSVTNDGFTNSRVVKTPLIASNLAKAARMLHPVGKNAPNGIVGSVKSSQAIRPQATPRIGKKHPKRHTPKASGIRRAALTREFPITQTTCTMPLPLCRCHYAAIA